MTMVQIIDHNDGAREVVELLGELGVMQLVDLNAGTMGNRRTFSDDLRRNDAVMKRLEFLERACIQYPRQLNHWTASCPSDPSSQDCR